MASRKNNNVFLNVETLEDRVVPSTTAFRFHSGPQANRFDAAQLQQTILNGQATRSHFVQAMQTYQQELINARLNNTPFSAQNWVEIFQDFRNDLQAISNDPVVNNRPGNNNQNGQGNNANPNNNQAPHTALVAPQLSDLVRKHLTPNQQNQYNQAAQAFNQAQQNLAAKQNQVAALQTDCTKLCAEADRLKKAWDKAKQAADDAQKKANDAQKAVDSLNSQIDQTKKKMARHLSDYRNLATSGLIRRWVRRYGPGSHEVQQARNVLQQQLDLYNQARQKLNNLQRQLGKAQQNLNRAKADAHAKSKAADAAKNAYDKAKAAADKCKNDLQNAQNCVNNAQQAADQAAEDLQDAQDQAQADALASAENALGAKQAELDAARQQATNQANIFAKALNVLGIIGQLNGKVSSEDQGLLAQWLGEMSVVGAGAQAPPGFGEALGALQAGYGIIKIRQSQLTPWHAGYRGDDHMIDWLIRKGHAQNRKEAQAIIKAMWQLRNNPKQVIQEARDKAKANIERLEGEVQQLQNDVNALKGE